MAKAQTGGAGSGTSSLTDIAQGWVDANIPYKYGGWGALQTFGSDCSAFISNVFAQAGYTVGGYTGTAHGPTSQDDATYGVKVASISKALPGDVIVFNEPGAPEDHVGLYAGTVDGVPMVYNEPQTGQNASLVPVSEAGQIAVIRRFINPKTGKPLGSGITAGYSGTLHNVTPGTAANPGSAASPGQVTTAPSGTTGTATGGTGNTTSLQWLQSYAHLLAAPGGWSSLNPVSDATTLVTRGGTFLMGALVFMLGLAVMIGAPLLGLLKGAARDHLPIPIPV